MQFVPFRPAQRDFVKGLPAKLLAAPPPKPSALLPAVAAAAAEFV